MVKLWGVVQKKSATLNLCIHALRILLLTTWERQYFGLAVGRLHGFSQRAEKELGVALRDESTGRNVRSVLSLRVTPAGKGAGSTGDGRGLHLFPT